MYEFAELDEVEHCLESLATREPDPLVAPMPRGRWAHLLGGVPDPDCGDDAGTARSCASDLDDRVAALEREVAELKQNLESFRRQFE